PVVVTSTPSSGTFAGSTATATLTFPSNQISLLNVFGTFTLPPLVATLFPLIDGEPVERILVVAAHGEGSHVTLISRSGKALPAAEMLAEAQ
ncbi:MAG: hypothetical protein ACREJU_20030, partial [Nitrospiraceae bacterium]